MHATRAAVEEGILPGGGGVALLRSIKAIEKIRTANDDQKIGVDIVGKALSWPAGQIAFNAGEDGSVVVGKILDKEEYNYGFDRRIRQPRRQGHHRPHQGRSRGAAGRGVGRRPAHHHRGHGGRGAEEAKRRRLPCLAEAWTSSLHELRLRCQTSMRT